MWQSIQKNMTWRAILPAGLAAGTAFLLIQVLFMPALMGMDTMLVMRYMASLILGSEVLVGVQNTYAVLGAGLVVHYVLSLVFALIIDVVIHRWGLLVGIIGGAILGVAVYLINMYTFTLLFPWFIAIDSAVFLLSHIVFGAVAGGVYELFDHYDEGLSLELTPDAT